MKQKVLSIRNAYTINTQYGAVTEHVIWVVVRCGTQATTVACWRHTEAEAIAIAQELTRTRQEYYFAVPCSDVPNELRLATTA